MNTADLPLQIIFSGGIFIAFVCYAIGMLRDYRQRKTKEDKRRFIFDASIFTVVWVSFFVALPFLPDNIKMILAIPFIVFCGFMAYRFKQPKSEPVGTGQPM